MEKYGVRQGNVVKYHPNGTFEFLTFGRMFTDEQANKIADLLNSEMGEVEWVYPRQLPDELNDSDRE